MSYFLAIIIQYSIFYIYIFFILQFFSGSSSLRRNFRHLAAPENNFLLLFQSVFCFFANYSNRLGGGGSWYNCRSKRGDIFQPDVQSETPFSPEEESVPRLAFIDSFCLFVFTRSISEVLLMRTSPEEPEDCSCKMMK